MDTSEWPMFKEPSWVAPTDGVSYLLIVIVFTFAVFAFEAYLDVRQHSAFTRNRGKQPPAGVEKETFEKSLAYGADKISFGMIEGTFSLLTGIAGTIGGYWPYLWTQSKIWTDMCVDRASTSPYKLECIQSIIFVVAFTLVETVITLPLSYWQTFKVEHSHGFNKTTVGLFFKDKLMVVLLTLFIGSPVIFAIIGLHLYFGPTFPWMIWAFLLVFSTFMMIIHPVLIAPLFNNYTEIKDGKLRDAVNALAARIEFPLTGLYVMDGSKRSSHSNAFFYGMWKWKRIVLFDTLIEQCTLDELLSILGHELGHWKLNHTMQGFLISQAYTLIFFLSYSYISTNASLFASFGFGVPAEGKPPVFIGLMVFMMSYWAPVDKVISFLANMNSRRNEFAADRFSKELGHEKGLASGLMTINKENLGNMVPDPFYSTYHFSHPPVVERVRALGVDVTKLKLNQKKKEAKKEEGKGETEPKKTK